MKKTDREYTEDNMLVDLNSKDPKRHAFGLIVQKILIAKSEHPTPAQVDAVRNAQTKGLGTPSIEKAIDFGHDLRSTREDTPLIQIKFRK